MKAAIKPVNPHGHGRLQPINLIRGKIMNTAEQQVAAYETGRMTWTEVFNEASEIANAYEQDYENEFTWFEYADGSVGLFDGVAQKIYAYGSRR